MVLGNITNVYNTNTYTLSCRLPGKYWPVIVRCCPLSQQEQLLDFPAKQKVGNTNINLWVDGSIYPLNPLIKEPPSFKDLKELICFIDDAVDGLFDYVNAFNCNSGHVERCESWSTLCTRQRKGRVGLKMKCWLRETRMIS
jgi:hypothetical protein